MENENNIINADAILVDHEISKLPAGENDNRIRLKLEIVLENEFIDISQLIHGPGYKLIIKKS